MGPPVGSPGYEQGGLLTEAIRNKPYQLILFDEIEKAHPEVMNLMLQLLDEGRLTDSRGVTVDFRNTIVILTSNIAHDVPAYKRLEVLTKYLRPELVNRIDDIISFNQLVENDMLKIVELNLRKLVKKAKQAQNLDLDITLFGKRWFVDELFTSKMGVRALKRLIQHEVENVMAMKIMSGEINYGDTVVIDSPDRTKLEIYVKGSNHLQESIEEEVINDEDIKVEEIDEKEVQEEINEPLKAVEQEKIVEVEGFHKVDVSKYLNEEDDNQSNKDVKEEQEEINELLDNIGEEPDESFEDKVEEDDDGDVSKDIKKPIIKQSFNPAIAAAMARARQATSRVKKSDDEE
ncbi:MAG: Chaperone protein ClpB [Alphaproteobacteria bacterium ADurb.Bin438]|nr:MAG: Chaperone protein ClpB [Alphaproteobacteria bacterium ADurb.Bin438]